MSPKTKVCRKCNDPKPIDDFAWKSKPKGIRHNVCKPCQRKYNESYYSANQAELSLKSKLRQRGLRDQ